MSGKLDKKNVEGELTMLCYFLVSIYLFYAFYSEIPFPNVSYVLSTNAIKLISVVFAYLILYSVVHYMVYKWNFIPTLFSMLFTLAFLLVFMTYCFYDSQCVSETKSISAAIFKFLLLILGGFLAFGLFMNLLAKIGRSYDESKKKKDDKKGMMFIFSTFFIVTILLLFEYYPKIQLPDIVAGGFFKLISVITIYAIVLVLFSFIVGISTEFPWLFSLFRVSTVATPFVFYSYFHGSFILVVIFFVIFAWPKSKKSKPQNQTYTYVSCDDDNDESYYSEADDEIYELRREHERLEDERREEQKRRDAERREEQKRKEAERREAEKRIVSVVQKGSSIRIYGSRGFLGSINAGNNGVLQGYTSDTVTVRRGRTVYLYNYRGQFIRSSVM